MPRNYKLLTSKQPPHTLIKNVKVTQIGQSRDPIQPKQSVACILEIMSLMLQECSKLYTQNNEIEIYFISGLYTLVNF